jgi:murein L,D-transpeptidase YafK
MSAERMAREAGNEWFDFWTQLREGYDAFERNKVPPEVTVRDGRYRFNEPH